MSVDGRRKRGYSLQIQTEVVYALARYLEVSESEEAEKTLVDAAEAIAKRHIGREPDGRLFVSRDIAGFEPEEAPRVDDVSLVLIALLEAHAVDPELFPQSMLQTLGRLLLSMQSKEGRFAYAEDALNRNARVPGRAVYALVQLYVQDRKPLWRRAARHGASYILRRDHADCDPWVLRGASTLLRMSGHRDGENRVAEPDFQRCAERLARRFVARAREGSGGRRRSCLAQPLPPADLLEAVLKYSTAGEAEEVRVRGFQDTANRSVRRLLRCQVRNGAARGGFMGYDSRNQMHTHDIQAALAALVAHQTGHHEAHGEHGHE